MLSVSSHVGHRLGSSWPDPAEGGIIERPSIRLRLQFRQRNYRQLNRSQGEHGGACGSLTVH